MSRDVELQGAGKGGAVADLDGLVSTVLAAVEPRALVRRALRDDAGSAAPFAAVVALGKGAAAMERGATDALGLPLAEGVAQAGVAQAGVAQAGASGAATGFWGFLARPESSPALAPRGVLGAWEDWPGGHPLPDVGSMGAGRRLVYHLGRLGAGDRLLALVSGGASACCEIPAGVLSMADLADAHRALLASGLPIDRVNAVRKHLSELKGGGALRHTAARVTVLVLSDVPGDDPSVVASGPFAADPSTYAEALGLADHLELPQPVRRHLEAGLAGELAETVKAGDPLLARVEHRLVGSNATAVAAAVSWLSAAGYAVEQGELRGAASAAGGELVARGRELRRRGGSAEKVALVLGGETTVSLQDGAAVETAKGSGGRNQELALAAARSLATPAEGGAAGAPGAARERVLTLATDGVDGPTSAAGARVDGATWESLRAAGVDPDAALARHTSHRALGRLPGCLVETGPTGGNVADLAIYLAG
jgi:glycerate-2-kinase